MDWEAIMFAGDETWKVLDRLAITKVSSNMSFFVVTRYRWMRN